MLDCLARHSTHETKGIHLVCIATMFSMYLHSRAYMDYTPWFQGTPFPISVLALPLIWLRMCPLECLPGASPPDCLGSAWLFRPLFFWVLSHCSPILLMDLIGFSRQKNKTNLWGLSCGIALRICAMRDCVEDTCYASFL